MNTEQRLFKIYEELKEKSDGKVKDIVVYYKARFIDKNGRKGVYIFNLFNDNKSVVDQTLEYIEHQEETEYDRL